jgi:hypothetical protein
MKDRETWRGEIVVRFNGSVFVDFGDGIIAKKGQPEIRVGKLRLTYKEKYVSLTINDHTRDFTYQEVILIQVNGEQVYNCNNYA